MVKSVFFFLSFPLSPPYKGEESDIYSQLASDHFFFFEVHETHSNETVVKGRENIY